MNFIKNALRELKHVVWPTREETKKYFVIVLSVLVAFGLFLFVFGSLFGNTLRWLKNIVNPSAPSITTTEIPANTIDENAIGGNVIRGVSDDDWLEIEWITVEWTSVDSDTGVVSELDSETIQVEPIAEEAIVEEAVVDTIVE